MILTLKCNNPKTITVCHLGLNIFHFVNHSSRKGVANNKWVANISDIVCQINIVKNGIIKDDPGSVEYICSNQMLKPLTLLKGIYPYKTNVYERRLLNILKDDDKKKILIQRLDMIIYTLNSGAA